MNVVGEHSKKQFPADSLNYYSTKSNNPYGLEMCPYCNSVNTRGVNDKRNGLIYATCTDCGGRTNYIEYDTKRGLSETAVQKHKELVVTRWNQRSGIVKKGASWDI